MTRFLARRALMTLMLASVVGGLCSGRLAAAELAKPTGSVILTIRGDITQSNGPDNTALFDLALLDKLPQSSFVTTTIWTKGKLKFSGVSLRALLDAVGAKGTKLRLIALNDYSVEMPVTDAIVGGPILASRLDGRTLAVRDKGPLWLVYPYDDNSAYRSEVIYSRSVWQLKAIEVIP